MLFVLKNIFKLNKNSNVFTYRAAVEYKNKYIQPVSFCCYTTTSTTTETTIRPLNKEKVEHLSEFGKYCQKCLPKYIEHAQIVTGDELELLIAPQGVLPLMYFLRNHQNAQFTNYAFVTAIDVPTRAYRFEVIYGLNSIRFNSHIRIKTYTDELTAIDSCCELFPGANWLEREVYDLFGVFFRNHPDLRRVLTDYGFQGHPLRKDFPMSGYLEVRYDDERKRVVYEPVEFAQEYRLFNLSNPWEQFPNFKSSLPATKTTDEAADNKTNAKDKNKCEDNKEKTKDC